MNSLSSILRSNRVEVSSVFTKNLRKFISLYYLSVLGRGGDVQAGVTSDICSDMIVLCIPFNTMYVNISSRKQVVQ